MSSAIWEINSHITKMCVCMIILRPIVSTHLFSRARKEKDLPFFMWGDPVQNRQHNPTPGGCLFSTRKSGYELPERENLGEEHCLPDRCKQKNQEPKKGINIKNLAETAPSQTPPQGPLTPQLLYVWGLFPFKIQEKGLHKEFRRGGVLGAPKFFLRNFFTCFFALDFKKDAQKITKRVIDSRKSQSVRETSRDESQTVLSTQQLFKTRDLELPTF